MTIEKILEMADRAAAFIELIRLYFDGPDEARKEIVKNWDFSVNWDLPNQTRLACQNGERWSCQERIEASLAYFAIAANLVGDYREELIALALIYQSCVIAGLDPYRIFEKIAKICEPDVRAMLMNFSARNEDDKSLAAFFLSAQINKDGEMEIRPTWA